jgi:glycosyltransferase involved in cell wall biosynthesis
MSPISVLLPARNASTTIKLAVTSTLYSLSSRDEVIVMLDPDDALSLEGLSSIKDSRLNVSISASPFSLSEKLNRGLEMAQHDLVARMDADDVCLPWRFAMQRKSIIDSGADFLFSPAIVFGRALRPLPVLPQLKFALRDVNFKKGLVLGNPGVHPTLLAKKNSLTSLGGYRNVAGEDLDLWLRAATSGFIFHRTAVPALLYRYQKSSLSRAVKTKTEIEESKHFVSLRLEVCSQLSPQLARLESKSEVSTDLLNEMRSLYGRSCTLKLESLNFGLNS